MITALNVKKQVKGSAGTLEILHDISFHIPQGQIVAIVGPSGSGKSTLLGLLAGLDAASAGSIKLDGQEITTLDEDQLALLRSQKVGFIFQAFHLIPNLTALENVAVPLELKGEAKADQRAQELLAAVGLQGRGHHYPVQLSGGEQQRVAVARAFAARPPILFADEPTGNLDSQNGEQVLQLLWRLNREQGTTLVVVTHDASLAARADRVLMVRDGNLVEDRLNPGNPS